MNNQILRDEVALKRRELAPKVGAFVLRVEETRRLLNELEQSCKRASADHWVRAIQNMHQESEKLKEELSRIEKRFQLGLVKIAIGGLEKAGKTTFLRTLTGIEQLPAFDERCTAVPCEIIYDHDRNDAELSFFTESEFMERVIGRLFDTVATGIADLSKRSGLATKHFANLAGFVEYKLPEENTILRGGAAATALRTLDLLQKNHAQLGQYLDKRDSVRISLDEMSEWIAHSDLSGPQAGQSPIEKAIRLLTIRRCQIFTNYKHGQDIVRLIDTPGVDDPSPRARLQTLDIIGEEADLLVVFGRPLNPSPTAPVIEFLDSVHRLPESHPARELILFAFNRDDRIENHEEVIAKHARLLMRDHEIQESRMLKPLNVTEPAAVFDLLEKLNSFLLEHMPKKDRSSIHGLQQRVASLEARVRLELLEPMSKDFPSDPALDSTRFNLFNQWSDSFWERIRKGIADGLEGIETNTEISDAQERLKLAFDTETKALDKILPDEQELADIIRTTDSSALEVVMREMLMPQLSNFVNAITKSVETFGSIIQTAVCEVLEGAGLSPLLKGESPSKRLHNLAEMLERAAGPSQITDKLAEIAETEHNLRMVFRWELRPAVDYCVPHYWRNNQADKDLRRMIEGFRGNVDKLQRLPNPNDDHPYGKLPGMQESPQEHKEAVVTLACNAIIAIEEALENNRFRLSKIAHDVLSDCRIAFCFGKGKEKEWGKALYAHAHLLIPSLNQLEQQSAFNRKLRLQLEDLDQHISQAM